MYGINDAKRSGSRSRSSMAGKKTMLQVASAARARAYSPLVTNSSTGTKLRLATRTNATRASDERRRRKRCLIDVTGWSEPASSTCPKYSCVSGPTSAVAERRIETFPIGTGAAEHRQRRLRGSSISCAKSELGDDRVMAEGARVRGMPCPEKPPHLLPRIGGRTLPPPDFQEQRIQHGIEERPSLQLLRAMTERHGRALGIRTGKQMPLQHISLRGEIVRLLGLAQHTQRLGRKTPLEQPNHDLVDDDRPGLRGITPGHDQFSALELQHRVEDLVGQEPQLDGDIREGTLPIDRGEDARGFLVKIAGRGGPDRCPNAGEPAAAERAPRILVGTAGDLQRERIHVQIRVQPIEPRIRLRNEERTTGVLPLPHRTHALFDQRPSPFGPAACEEASHLPQISEDPCALDPPPAEIDRAQPVPCEDGEPARVPAACESLEDVREREHLE